MKQVFLANPKGGCGKTTLATQIAAWAAGQGLAVVLVDHDEQQSSMDWLRLRRPGLPPVYPVAAFRGATLPSLKVDLVVHDMPARVTCGELERWWSYQSKLLIPLQASPTDVLACMRFLGSLNANGWPVADDGQVGVVANRIKHHAQYQRVLNEFIASVNVSLVASLRDTQNYVLALASGYSLFEMPASRVATDLQQWQDLTQWLCAAESSTVQQTA